MAIRRKLAARHGRFGSFIAGLRGVAAYVWRHAQAVCSRLLPTPFPDAPIEASFLLEFRRAGLKSTSYACFVAIIGYLMIGTVDIAFNGWSAVSALRRLLVISLLGLIVVLIAIRPAAILRHYCVAFGALVFAAYVCSVSITHLFRDDDPTIVVNPTALIGLWIIYGFVRLPLRLSALLGAAGGCFALFGSRVTNMPDPMIRTFVYLLICNALGFVMARSIETRERQLFNQKRTLEEAQHELRRRSLVAEQASATKTRLVAAVGHDLRQPMMAARLHLSVLMQKVLAGDGVGANRQAERVQQSVKLLGDTLEHLLLAARYDAGTERTNVRRVPLAHIFHALSHLCDPQALEQGATLLIRPPRPEIYVVTDEQIFLRALVNLVSNALKFLKSSESLDPSRVVVRASLVGSVCKIIVMDNGIGIAESNQDSIWEPFFQVGNAERNRAGGMGLGLFLVRQSLLILEEHQVCVRSRLGLGTCFTLTLPGGAHRPLEAAPIVLPASDAEIYSSERSRLCGMHVVLVEDDHDAREALETQLTAWGVSWASGPTMDEVLADVVASGCVVDAIIADFRLPRGVDGVSSIRIARDRLGYCPDAVLMTAEVDRRVLEGALPERCALIRKPFEPLLLYQLLSAARAYAS